MAAWRRHAGRREPVVAVLETTATVWGPNLGSQTRRSKPSQVTVAVAQLIILESTSSMMSQAAPAGAQKADVIGDMWCGYRGEDWYYPRQAIWHSTGTLQPLLKGTDTRSTSFASVDWLIQGRSAFGARFQPRAQSWRERRRSRSAGPGSDSRTTWPCCGSWEADWSQGPLLHAHQGAGAPSIAPALHVVWGCLPPPTPSAWTRAVRRDWWRD